MLTKSEIELNQSQHLRLSPPSEPPSSDVTKELDETIAELTAHSDLNLNGDQVTLVVLRVLAELLRRTKPRTATIPMMTGFDPPSADDDELMLRLMADTIRAADSK